MRWTTICFDLDNTLFSHEEAFEKAICFCFEEILKRKKVEKTPQMDQLFSSFKKYSDLYWDDYEKKKISPQEYRRKRFLETATEFDLPFNEIDADDFHEHYYDVVDEFSEPYSNLHSFMKLLLNSKIKMGIITNGAVHTQYNKIKKLELNQWFSRDSIFVSEQLKISKPAKEIFDLAKQKLNSCGGHLFVGDSWEHDVVGAIEAGWDAIYLNTRKEAPTTPHVPIGICSSLDEVVALICKENQLKG